MSGASNQAVRAGIRESSGTGGNNNNAAAVGNNNPLMPSLVVDDDRIVELLKGQSVAKKNQKYDAMKGIYAVRAGLSTLLSGLEPGLGTELEQINWDEKNGGGGGLKGVASWAADNLGQIIFDLHHALKKVMPRAQHHPKLLQPQIQPIRTLHVMYQQALHLATTELNRQFSSQFVTLKGADKRIGSIWRMDISPILHPIGFASVVQPMMCNTHMLMSQIQTGMLLHEI